jgi:hypothetical protein
MPAGAVLPAKDSSLAMAWEQAPMMIWSFMLAGWAWVWDPDCMAWDWGAARAMEPENRSSATKRIGIQIKKF